MKDTEIEDLKRRMKSTEQMITALLILTTISFAFLLYTKENIKRG